MSDTLPDVARLEHAAKTARRAVALALCAVVVMVAVLAIDQQIKRDIISEAVRMRRLLDELRGVIVTGEVVANGRGTGQAAAASGPAADADAAVADAAGTPKAAGDDARRAPRTAGSRAGRTPRGTRGDG